MFKDKTEVSAAVAPDIAANIKTVEATLS